ncbi:MAG: hypothetical protein FVQ77_07185 [Cytophagales bacterium]|nr:hypothetical protein [Cytophagales bacterium]
MERDYFEEIKILVKEGLIKEAKKKLKLFSELISSKPSYQGYYWRAKAYDCVDYKKYASKILEDINSASAKEIIEQLPQKELPVPALLLKAKAYSNLNQHDLGVTTIDVIFKRKQVGKPQLAEAYRYRAIIKAQINPDEEFGMDDLKKASLLGDKIAQDHLDNINYKKKR